MAEGLRFSIDRRALAAAAVRKAAAEGLGDATEMLLEEANRTVPIEEATLMRSGVASVDDMKLRGAVSYDTPYAVRQHEDLRLRHDQGRRAKWLESTFKERGRSALGVVAAKIRAVT